MELALRAVRVAIFALLGTLPSPAFAQARVFPAIAATDLNGKNVTIPRDFDAELDLCVIAFDRAQQKNCVTWMNGTKSIIGLAGVSVYEIPTIRRLPPFVQGFINSGMRHDIPDATDRSHTITLYIDKTPFRESLGLGTEKTIYAVLVDRSGTVLWSAAGDFTSQDGDSLRACISGLNRTR